MRRAKDALAGHPGRWFVVEHEGHAAEFGCRSARLLDALGLEAAASGCRVYPLLGYRTLDSTVAALVEGHGHDAWYAAGMPGYEEAVAEQERLLLGEAQGCLAAAGLDVSEIEDAGRPCLAVGAS